METVFFAHRTNTELCRFYVVFFAFIRANDDVLGSGKDVDQLEVLMDHTDIVSEGVLRGANADLLTAHEDAALVGVIDACQHIHQGGLSTPVLAEE